MAQLDPVVNAGLLYVNNLQVAYASATTLTIAAGAARGVNNVVDIVLSTGVTLNAAVNGLNGLDTGSLTTSTFYYVYVISASTNRYPTGTILSLSKTAPTLPAGYDTYRMIDVQLTDSSSHFVITYNSGNGSVRTKVYDTMLIVLSSGTSQTLALVDCSSALPPLAQNLLVYLPAIYVPNAAGDNVGFAMPGSTATTIPKLGGQVAHVAATAVMTIFTGISSGIQQFQYINSAASGAASAYVYGYQFSL